MNATSTAIIIALVSILGNIIQYFLNKKSSDMSTLNNQVKLLGKLQEEQSKAYERNKKIQQNEIERLKKQVDKQNKILESNKNEIIELQISLNQLIGNGCHVVNCERREPYSMTEINKITKLDNNEKDNEHTC